METDQERSEHKDISFARKNVCLPMKWEWVLTMKIVDNFVHFGMP